VRLATYELDGAVGCGVVVGDGIVPLPGESVRGILERGPDHWATLAASAAARGDDAIPLAGIRLVPPIPDPDKILCIGLNYRDHAEETGMPAPPAPIVFAKFRNSLIDLADPIVGYTRTPPRLVAAEDLVEVEIETVGLLANRVIEHATLRS
jgi:hypothetical protein